MLPLGLTACSKHVCTMFGPCSQAGFAGSKNDPAKSPLSLTEWSSRNCFTAPPEGAQFEPQNIAFLHVREICSCQHMFACSRACSKHVRMFGMFVCNSSVKAHVRESMFACSQ